QTLRTETREFFHKNNIRYIRTGNWRVRFHTDNLDDVRDWCRISGLHFSYDAKTDVVTSEYVTSAVPVDQRGDVVFCNSILPVLWQEDEGHDKSLVRLENGLPIPEEIVREIRDVTKRNRVLVKMRQNDVIWVDNTRALHGRMEFDDPDRNVGVRMGRHISW
ncbi:MAG: TauD/TfdA family dioxygenase, partial [Methylococcales bacterium]